MKEKQISLIPAPGVRCHVCGGSAVEIVSGYELFHRVTSDCKPWHAGGQLCVCRTCGCVQKVIDPAWQFDIDKVYRDYSIYHQSEGIEQSVFEGVSGQALPRSARLLERLNTHIQLPKTGRLLDVGCGNGALLRSFNDFAPLWSLLGTELNDKYKMYIESIDNVEALYICAPEQVPGVFNLITMIHLLEHIIAPKDFLARLRDKLEVGGLLLIEIPDYHQNPFDLLIADHCTHFTVASITELVQSAGYEVISVATDWIPKELTVVARKIEHPEENCLQVSKSFSFDSVVRSLQWLESVVIAARQLSTIGTFGIFGTSIAATWLFSELEHSISFFVDEDPHRAGKIYMDRPVYHPREVPGGCHVFIALPTKLAESVWRRVEKSSVKYHLPPRLMPDPC